MRVTILISILILSGSAVITAQEEPSSVQEEPAGVSPETEIQLIDVTPTIRDIAVRLEGTEKEEQHLVAVRELVNRILASSKPKIVRVPVGAESVALPIGKQSERVIITLSLQPVAENEQQYKLGIKLQETEEAEGDHASFDYTPQQVDVLQQQLETFLFEHLNLQSVAKPVVTEETTQVEEVTQPEAPTSTGTEETLIQTPPR